MNLKNHSRLIFLVALLGLGGSLEGGPLRYRIEPSHSTVGFSVPIFGGLTRVSGKFTAVEVEIVYDPDQPDASSVTAVLQVSGIDTGIEMRDQDLQGEMFFNAQVYPEIRFVSRQVSRKPDGTYQAAGSLTMRGITLPVTLPFELTLHRFEDGNSILGVKIRSELNRLDYGVGKGWKHTTMENFLGETIQVEIDLWTRNGKPIE